MKNTIKKATLSLGTAASIVAPIAAVVSCGTQEDTKVNYVASTFVKGSKTTEVAAVTDGGNREDKSFNEQAWLAAQELVSATTTAAKDGAIMSASSTSASAISDAYAQAVTAGKKTLILSGFMHVTPLKSFSQKHPEMAFVLVDGILETDDLDANGKKKIQGNVASLMFKTEQAAFLAGYLASKKVSADAALTNPTIGNKDNVAKIRSFGGMEIPSVTAFIKGFKGGVDYFNTQNPSLTQVDFANSGYIGNFGADEKGSVTTKANALIADGADMILPVGGPQAVTVVNAAVADATKSGSTSNVQVIGVDTDLKMNTNLTEQVQRDHVFTSILKQIKTSAVEAVNAIYGTAGTVINNVEKNVLGKIYTGGLHEGWVGLPTADWDTNADVSTERAAVEAKAAAFTL